MGKCLIFCAAEFDGLAAPIGVDDYLLAADGGLRHLQKLNLSPHGIIGDFDSLGYIPTGAEVFPVEKDDTDAMLAARKGLELGYRHFLFYGSLDGKRLDHTLANLQTLWYIRRRGARGYLYDDDFVWTVIENESLTIERTVEWGLFSAFCLGDRAEEIDETGFQYSLENAVLTADFPLGVSNHIMEPTVTVSVGKGTLAIGWELSPMEDAAFS